MSISDPSVDSVSQVCRSAGFEFNELQRVRKGVYTGSLANRQLGSTNQVYVKVYPSERQQALREFAEIAVDVGHPECHAILDRFPCLLMATASGTPLSRLLPLYLLPGIWTLFHERMEHAYYQAGRSIGLLHSKTRDGSGVILDETDTATAIDQADSLDDRLPSEVIADIKQILEQKAANQTPHTLTYGDRSPHNMYYDGGTLTHIDCTCKRRGAVADHTTVLFGIRLMVARLPYAPNSIKIALENAYWDGYKHTGLKETVRSEAIDIRYLALSLRMLEYYRSDPTSLNSRITKHVDPPFVYREIEQTIHSRLR